MKETFEYFQKKQNEIYELGEKLFKTPELGYKEFRTKAILCEFLKKSGFEPENECFETAFSISLGEGHPHIGLIAELDAIPTLGHPYANKDDSNAAHACGHSTQTTIMSTVMAALKEKGIPHGKVTLFFTPGEEYTDLAYRRKLIREKKIRYIGGKTNMLESGMFDDVDMFIHLHAMGNSDYHFSLNSLLGGFVHKTITFKGKAAHAAVLPHKGINALNAFVLFDNALNMLRETFRDEDMVRVHGMIDEGGQTVNSIPERVIYECYVRSVNKEAMLSISEKIDNAAKYAAKAIGASASVKTSPGYLPLYQDRKINSVIRGFMKEYCSEEEIYDNEISIAAGDVGDISMFKPIVQFGYGGFKGNIHGKDLEMVDYEKIFLEPSAIVFDTVNALLNNDELTEKIISGFKPKMTKEEYLKYISQ